MQPLDDRSKLAVQAEGLERLRAIKGSVCPMAVIGPYRSGKSFTLNQLMGVRCGESVSAGVQAVWCFIVEGAQLGGRSTRYVCVLAVRSAEAEA